MSLRRVVLLQSFEHVDIIAINSKNIDKGKKIVVVYLFCTITLTAFVIKVSV